MKIEKLSDGEYENISDNRGGRCPRCSKINYYCECETIILRKLPDNPMPELEIGDWYRATSGGVLKWAGDQWDQAKRDNGLINEIRKQNGVVWRRR